MAELKILKIGGDFFLKDQFIIISNFKDLFTNHTKFQGLKNIFLKLIASGSIVPYLPPPLT